MKKRKNENKYKSIKVKNKENKGIKINNGMKSELRRAIGNSQETNNSLNINWYPGHMTKTKRQIAEDVKLVDIIVELLDSRIPIASQNPDIAEIINNKPKIIALNKSDLADEIETKKWVEYYKKEGIPAIVTDSNSGKGMKAIIAEAENLIKEKLDERENKGRIGRTIKIMVLGIPNVGKSSFINRMANKNSLVVGNKPGVTKAKQWIRISKTIELLDTPGVLWPKLSQDKIALNLAYTGTIKDDNLEKIEVAYNLVKYLIENELDKFSQRYNFEAKDILNHLQKEDKPENELIYEIMQNIGKSRGAIISGGNVDDEKTANLILEDFRSGKIGKITLEKVQ